MILSRVFINDQYNRRPGKFYTFTRRTERARRCLEKDFRRRWCSRTTGEFGKCITILRKVLLELYENVSSNASVQSSIKREFMMHLSLINCSAKIKLLEFGLSIYLSIEPMFHLLGLWVSIIIHHWCYRYMIV